MAEHPCEFPGCGKMFEKRPNMLRHMKLHGDNKSHVCEYPGCNSAFVERGNLTKHMKTHLGIKDFKCTWEGCTLTFARAEHVKKHMRTHTGERPYACDHPGCTATFAESGHLTNHKRTHSGERPYVCDYAGCTSAFTVSANLVTHKRTHSGEKPYACKAEGCSARFAKLHHLNCHTASQHTESGMKKRKIKEDALAAALTTAGVDFKREHQVSVSCLRADHTFSRIDFLILSKGAVIFLECDEDQHVDYMVSCDVRRMMDVTAAMQLEGNTLPVHWIRFNPDTYHVDGKARMILMKERYRNLVSYIEAFTTTQPLSVQYLYYDRDAENQLLLLKDPDYEPSFKEFVLA